MKKNILIFGIALIGCIILFAMKSLPIITSSKKEIITSAKKSTEKEAVVLLELFTSQGCSSCPSADELVGEYRNNPNIIALAYHVDYWNRLGWIDTFSNASYSQRQRDYAEQFKLDGIYTPQLVVNGTVEFVGSNKQKLDDAINIGLSNKNTNTIFVNEVVINDNTLSVNFSSNTSFKNNFFTILLVQNQATTYIKHGENKGLKLTNYNIVRDLVKLSKTNGKQNTILKLPKWFDSKNYSIVILEQDSDNAIIAATKKLL